MCGLKKWHFCTCKEPLGYTQVALYAAKVPHYRQHLQETCAEDDTWRMSSRIMQRNECNDHTALAQDWKKKTVLFAPLICFLYFCIDKDRRGKTHSATNGRHRQHRLMRMTEERKRKTRENVSVLHK